MKMKTANWKKFVSFAVLPTLLAVPLLSASSLLKATDDDDVVKPLLCEPYPECVIYQYPSSTDDAE